MLAGDGTSGLTANQASLSSAAARQQRSGQGHLSSAIKLQQQQRALPPRQHANTGQLGRKVKRVSPSGSRSSGYKSTADRASRAAATGSKVGSRRESSRQQAHAAAYGAASGSSCGGGAGGVGTASDASSSAGGIGGSEMGVAASVGGEVESVPSLQELSGQWSGKIQVRVCMLPHHAKSHQQPCMQAQLGSG